MLRVFLLVSLLLVSSLAKKRSNSIQATNDLAIQTTGVAECGWLQLPHGTLHDSSGEWEISQRYDAIHIFMCDNEGDHSGCNGFMQLPKGIMVSTPRALKKTEQYDFVWIVTCEPNSPGCAMMSLQPGLVYEANGKLRKSEENTPFYLKTCQSSSVV